MLTSFQVHGIVAAEWMHGSQFLELRLRTAEGTIIEVTLWPDRLQDLSALRRRVGAEDARSWVVSEPRSITEDQA